MAAGKLSLVLEKGADFQLPITFQDESGQTLDLTGFDARMQIRETKSSSTVIVDLTVGNGRITIDGPNGIVSLFIANADTTTIIPNKGVYDLELIDGLGFVSRELEGPIDMSAEVTR